MLRRIDGLVFPCLIDGQNPFEGHCRKIAFINNVPRLEELYDQYDPSVHKYERSICHIGSLTYHRGITHVVKAAEKAECTMYLGGVFSPASYEDQIRALPEFARVRYLGKLDRAAVLETLQHCQIGVATLLNVGQYYRIWNLSTKVYEQMALGLPCVLNDSAYNQQVVQKHRFGICVDPENPEEIANAIRYLLDNPEEARRMGENGRRAVKEEFNWSVEEEKLLALYENILKE